MPSARHADIEPGPNVPRTGGALSHAIGRLALRVLGWRIEGALPDLPRFVIIVAPHTSNWDFPVGAAAKLALRLDATFLAKHTLFRFPLGILMRALGGFPVNRDASHDLVSGILGEFARREKMVLVVAPEGTRRKVERWRTGFYHIAHGAGVPVVPIALDWSVRTVRIGAAVPTRGDVEREIRALRDRYAGVAGRQRR